MPVAELIRMPSRPLQPLGRLVDCAACHQLVDVIEINLGGHARMRPDLCGRCVVAGHDPEPRPPEPRT